MATIRRVAVAVVRAPVGVYAAALAYSFLFSLVPLLLFLTALAGALHLPSLLRVVAADGALPGPVRAVLEQSLSRLAGRPSAALMSIGVVGYLWGMSGAVRQGIVAVRAGYAQGSGPAPPWWWAYAWSLVLSVTVGALFVLEVALTLAGDGVLAWAAARVGLALPLAVLAGVRWLGAVALFAAMVTLLYRLAPERGGPLLPGVIVAVGIWLGASLGLSLYAPRLVAASPVYGALGGVILLALYLDLVALAVVVGAHVNGAWRPPPADAAGPGR